MPGPWADDPVSMDWDKGYWNFSPLIAMSFMAIRGLFLWLSNNFFGRK
jgi:hypothetical protein